MMKLFQSNCRPRLNPLSCVLSVMLLSAVSTPLGMVGADETDATLDLGIAISDAKHPLLSWEAEPGRTYSILHSPDLVDFSTLQSGLSNGGAEAATLEFQDTNVVTDSQSTAFYKVVLDALDEEDPVISSGGTGVDLVENSGADQVVYTTVASDNVSVASYTLDGTDASLLAISTSGEVTLTANPDYENKSSYSFDVIVADAEGNTATQAVSFSITDVDDEAPVISSGGTGVDLVENSGADQVVYTTVASDNVGVASYTLDGTDASLLAISTMGEVTLTANPDYENKSSYSFDVIVADAEGNTATQAVSFSITDVGSYTIKVRSYSYDPLTEEYSHNTFADDLEFQTDVQGCTVWTRIAQPHGEIEVEHDHFNAYVDPIYVYDPDNSTFTWTEYGSEESLEAIEATCAAGVDGVTKTVDETGYYKDKNNHSVYLQILSVVAN
jgi:hypothetical protein